MQTEVGATYQHYKNREYYQVLTLAYDSDTLEEVVVYRGLYQSPELGDQPTFVRARAEFEEVVLHNAIEVNRFTKVEDTEINSARQEV